MPDFAIETQYEAPLIAGVDEAGRGPLAGPVVAAAVILNRSCVPDGIRDSKKLSHKQREALYAQITRPHHHCGVGVVSSLEIDEINILEATKKACLIAVSNLPVAPGLVLVDGNMQFNRSDFVSVIKGDDKSLSIAAASIVAKVTRDRIMLELSSRHPEYLWHKNSGYGTKHHLEAIKTHGLSEHHRKSFKH